MYGTLPFLGRWSWAWLLLVLAACSSQSTPPAEPPAEGSGLQRLEIDPPLAGLALGTEVAFTVTGIYADGSRRDLATEVDWRLEDEALAELPVPGRVRALQTGRTRLLATLDGRQAAAELEITPATLERLSIEPLRPRLALGTRLALQAHGLFSDGSRQRLDDQAVWESLDPALASVSPDGEVAALGTGLARIRVTVGGLSSEVEVTISGAELVALRASPAAIELPAGTTASLRLDALYSDGLWQEVTGQADWQSLDPGVAGYADGRVQAVAAGSTRLRAGFGGLGVEVPVAVGAAVLERIELSGAADPLPAGLSRPLRALGHFSDGSLQDLEGQVLWSSSDPGVLAVSNAAGSAGLATAISPGAVTVSATLDGIEARATLTVSAAVLETLEVEPVAPRLARGTDLTLHVVGRFSDGSLRELDDEVSWRSDDPGIAAVGNVRAGRLLAVAEGTTRVRVDLDGVTASVPVTVTAASLEAITIEPGEIVLASGERLALRALGSFSDGSVQVLGDDLRWETADAAVATVDASGLLRAVAAGEGRVSASLDGVTGSVPVQVSDATLVDLEVTLPGDTLAGGSELGPRAVAVYSDGSRRDVTDQVVWSSSDEAVLGVDNGGHPVMRGKRSGTAMLMASFGGVQAEVPVNVSEAVLSGLRIEAPASGLRSGESLRLAAVAEFSDGSSQPLEDGVVWRSSDPALASVGNAGDNRGRVTAADSGAGRVTITATYGGQSASVDLDVISDPTRPVSLTVLPQPNLLLNDGLDTSRITVRLRAADPAQAVPDGTPVTLRVLQAGQVLQTLALSSSGGEAGLDFTTTASGLLQVEASADDGRVLGRGLIYAGPDPLLALVQGVFLDADVANGEIAAGSRFGLFLFNTSNRDIAIRDFVLDNGGTTLASVTDPARLNGGWLAGGMQLGFVVRLDEAVPDQGVSASFLLVEPGSGNDVRYGVRYKLQ